jgi:hypothetical protein
MSDQPETITHPVFGELRWEVARSVWFTQVRDATGEWIDVSVEPGNGDRFACLDGVADLYSQAMRAERQVLRTAVQKELLELYNDTWRQSDEPELTTDEFMSRLGFTFIQIRTDFKSVVILSYGAGDLFGGHSVDVELDNELRHLNVDLIG